MFLGCGGQNVACERVDVGNSITRAKYIVILL